MIIFHKKIFLPKKNRVMSKLSKIILLYFVIVVLSSCCNAQPKQFKIEVLNRMPHDENSYTQGLFFNDGNLYESSGGYGESAFRKVDLATGKALKRLDFDSKYFVEGSVILADKLFILTWQNKVAFIYDAATLKYKSTYSYPREGWGLTTDGSRLIASDGSSRLFFMDDKFQVNKILDVKLNGRSISNLNELEYIDGKIWANVYLTDIIVIINPEKGSVEATVDCTGLLPASLTDSRTDVLNGIAYDPVGKKIYLTGKYWKKMYEIKLVAKK